MTVAFGAGLNTAVPGPAGQANHHLLPEEIVVKKGGVVSFVVAGFHQIFVYNPGVRPRDVLAKATENPMDLYINYGFPADPADPRPLVFYAGINPGFPPPPSGEPPQLPPPNPAGPPPLPFFSNAFNRVEPVVFPETGRFLVLCNINPHFLDGMWAWVRVVR